VLLHDFWAPYWHFGVAHAVCGAHLGREPRRRPVPAARRRRSSAPPRAWPRRCGRAGWTEAPSPRCPARSSRAGRTTAKCSGTSVAR